jgi:PKD domain
MRRSRPGPAIGYRGLLVTALIALFVGVVSPPAMAAPPSNDDFDSTAVIGALPFHTYLDTRDVTAAADDPCLASSVGNGSVWFSYTPPSDTLLRVEVYSTDYYRPTVSVYTGSRGSLTPAAGTCDSTPEFFATANVTYHFMVSSCCDADGGNTNFFLGDRGWRANDDFANATVIDGLPYFEHENPSAATREEGEPASCGGTTMGTAWYAFTPTETAPISAVAARVPAYVAAYTGSSVSTLSEVGCEYSGNRVLTFWATAGQTYFFQVSDAFSGIPTSFGLFIAPAPQVSFYTYPSDPSTFDNIFFSHSSYDPVGHDITVAWQLGDGTVSTEPYFSHQYASEGDYTVNLTATTTDGRVASVSSVVHVRTHDVAITKFVVPKSAHAGQTRTITVEITNSRYPETVLVGFDKTIPGGGVQNIGSVTQSVPANPNHSTPFTINYTFTNADAEAGKVTFTAYAVIQGARDAILGDNEAIAFPTRVTG